jgi:hypothetical protein
MDILRIAMWSGPRNLSTAMMYAFGARPDCAVVDEPFYAAYLAATGLAHPMRAEILAAQPTDPATVAAACLGPVPGGRPVFYQKHMTHHMLPQTPRGWMAAVRNVFLIRHPARVVASYAAKREDPVLDDLGFRQQADLFDSVARATGTLPLVIDAADIRAAPEAMLRRLCTALDLAFDPAMLHWPAGGHPADGVWAPHWYGAVHRSTGFAGPEGPLPALDGAYARLAAAAMPQYERLAAVKL